MKRFEPVNFIYVAMATKKMQYLYFDVGNLILLMISNLNYTTRNYMPGFIGIFKIQFYEDGG